MAFRTTATLTEEQHAFAVSLVEGGQYASVSAVLREGIDELRRLAEREAREAQQVLEAREARLRDKLRVMDERRDQEARCPTPLRWPGGNPPNSIKRLLY